MVRPLSEQEMAEVGLARQRDGAEPEGLTRVARMTLAARSIQDEDVPLSRIRPDLGDEDSAQTPSRARLMRVLMRNSGPVRRLSTAGVIRKRIDLGLS